MSETIDGLEVGDTVWARTRYNGRSQRFRGQIIKLMADTVSVETDVAHQWIGRWLDVPRASVFMKEDGPREE